MSTNRLLPNPARIIAGRLNQMKSRGLTAAGRERLRQSALANRPWVFSTGPRTAVGKLAAAANGRWRQTGEQSCRQLQAMLAGLGQLAEDMATLRRSLRQGEMVLP